MYSSNNIKIAQQITRFASNNQLLERMEAKLNDFNPFKVLKITHQEIRHSNMLGWLLNPKESHYFSDYFLKKIINEILCGDVVLKNHTLTITDILKNDFSDAEILREWRNIDLVIYSKKNDLAILIENKVYAGLAEHQLEKYVKVIKEAYPSVSNLIPVYLTINGDEAPNEEYYSLSHLQILEILKLVLEIYKDRLSPRVYDFIFYYIKTLEEITMQDEQLISLCKDIYKQHKEAIDAIIKYGILTNSILHEVIDQMKGSNLISITDNSIEPRLFKSDKELWFLPSSLSPNLPNLVKKWKCPFPIAFFFAKEEKRLRLILEIGPISDGNVRLDLLNRLICDKSDLFSASESALTNINGSYTRIRTSTVKVNDWEDISHLTERVQYILKEFKYSEVLQVLEIIVRGFNQFSTHREI